MVEEFSLSGYEDSKELLAQRYNRAGKSLFVVALPIHLVATHLPIPDPNKPFEDNRRVNESHAAKFGDYWRANVKWAAPPLLLDTTFPLNSEFEPKLKVGDVEFGVMHLPHNSADELVILDGQHRILGWKIAAGRIAEELKKARVGLQTAKETEDLIGADVYTKKVAELNAQVKRMRTEYVTLEILVGVTPEDHRQYFNDIAVNARGITKSVTASFDQREMLNRIAMSLAEEHPLLAGRVDLEKDVVRSNNPNIISGKALVDTVRSVVLGVVGRMTVRREKAFNEVHIEKLAKGFFDALVESFPELQQIVSEELHPADLRDKSLLGSTTVWRVLAGAYNGLAVDSTDEDSPQILMSGDEAARDLFKSLSGELTFPIVNEWFDTGYFPEPTSKAPSSRAQDLRGLADLLVEWGTSGAPFSV